MRHLPRRGFVGGGQRSAFGQCPPDLSGATALQFPDRRQLEHRRRADETCRRKAHRRRHRQPGGLCSIAYALKALAIRPWARRKKFLVIIYTVELCKL